MISLSSDTSNKFWVIEMFFFLFNIAMVPFLVPIENGYLQPITELLI